MSAGIRSLILALLVLVAGTFGSWAQASQPSPLPEPYRADEFPEWVQDLRRWEIVSLGAFPLILFYTRLGFDFGRYAESGFLAEYAPWPFKSEYSYSPSRDEQVTAVLTAAALSAAFGLVDAAVLKIRRSGSP